MQDGPCAPSPAGATTAFPCFSSCSAVLFSPSLNPLGVCGAGLEEPPRASVVGSEGDPTLPLVGQTNWF